MRIRIGDATILEHVLARLRPQCARLILNANPIPRALPTPVCLSSPTACRIFRGRSPASWPGSILPRHRLRKSTGSSARRAIARSCRAIWCRGLHQARLDAGATIACAASGGRRHPVIALWPAALREDLRRALTEEGARKVGEWSARYAVAVADWPIVPVDPFFNVNTPDDVAEAERLAAALSGRLTGFRSSRRTFAGTQQLDSRLRGNERRWSPSIRPRPTRSDRAATPRPSAHWRCLRCRRASAPAAPPAAAHCRLRSRRRSRPADR